jgi:hypothetical protein
MSANEKHLLSDFLPECPAPGEGVHSWLMSAAWAAKKLGIPAESAMAAISSAISRPPRGREIEEAVTRVYGTEPGTIFPSPIKAKFDPEALKQLASKLSDFTESDLIARSPVPPEQCTAASFLFGLFCPQEKVAVFTRMTAQPDLLWECPADRKLLDAGELCCVADPPAGQGVWFLANPVSGDIQAVARLTSERNPCGLTLRAEENLTTFRYLVVESDHVQPELWIKALAQIPLPISSIVTSGGRSIHALVRIDAGDADEWKTIKARIAPALVTLGGDPGAMTTVRLTRLPCCFRREKSEMQRLLFLNPEPTSTPICQLPTLRSF